MVIIDYNDADDCAVAAHVDADTFTDVICPDLGEQDDYVDADITSLSSPPSSPALCVGQNLSLSFNLVTLRDFHAFLRLIVRDVDLHPICSEGF
ncbi:hypothetical protein CCR75_005555 [Bremia lactucae]|uniref:Uncharacterized protein n=1 Tax=Bremia lactucae TaxID=4779 RepID=A0A976IE11_BRELC|nr:hypothetical protein CCR75_005555 [Bremia lactucae]